MRLSSGRSMAGLLAIASYVLTGGCEFAEAMVVVTGSIDGGKANVMQQHHQPTTTVVTTTHPTNTRRTMLATLSTLSIAAVMIPSSSCQAQEEEKEEEVDDKREGKPFAPPSALLPATRLKVVVDQMYDLSTRLSSSSTKNTNTNIDSQYQYQYQTLQEMNRLWTTRQPLFQKEKQEKSQPQRSVAPSSSAAAQLTTGVSSANKQQYKDNRKDMSLPDRMAAMLNQADVERQWGMLQYQESKMEQGNELRAALNQYTSQLEFGSAYLLTATKEERKKLIRNEQLPSLTAVITSDLDLRDLYRNDFLTAMEDAAAEIAYQLKQQPPQGDVLADVSDVVELMGQAHASLTKWFDLIAAVDVQEAMVAISNEL